MLFSECDTCIDNLLDDLEALDSEMYGVADGLQTVSIGIAAMRRLESANTSVFTFQVSVILKLIVFFKVGK